MFNGLVMCRLLRINIWDEFMLRAQQLFYWIISSIVITFKKHKLPVRDAFAGSDVKPLQCFGQIEILTAGATRSSNWRRRRKGDVALQRRCRNAGRVGLHHPTIQILVFQMRKNELHFLVLLLKGKILNEKLDWSVFEECFSKVEWNVKTDANIEICLAFMGMNI